jgi:hypothetical protein
MTSEYVWRADSKTKRPAEAGPYESNSKFKIQNSKIQTRISSGERGESRRDVHPVIATCVAFEF